MTKQRQGELLMLLFSLFESWFPIVSIVAVKSLGGLFAYAFTASIATLFFFGIVLFRRKMREFLILEAYRDLLLTTFFITLMFSLIFVGLQYTTAGNMAVIVFMQLFFSYLYFNLFGKEKLDLLHTVGAFAMGAGAIIILFPEAFSFNRGDLLGLCAAALAPVANFFQKRARSYVSSESVLAFRSLFSLPFLFALAFLLETLPTPQGLRQASFYLLINGALLMGVSKLLWVEALHRISITKTSALAALVPLFTLLFAYLVLDELPTLRQLVGILPILVGGYLITRPYSGPR
jgi:drug/metabolite transporter (DMT)-like permease